MITSTSYTKIITHEFNELDELKCVLERSTACRILVIVNRPNSRHVIYDGLASKFSIRLLPFDVNKVEMYEYFYKE